MSWWLWGAALVALVASPALALSTLMLGLVVAGLGGVIWARRGAAGVCAAGLGLVVGSLPYMALVVGQVLGWR